MRASLGHLQLNVSKINFPFYKALMKQLFFSVLHEEENILGYGDKNHSSIWFIATDRTDHGDRDGIGLNHIALNVQNPKHVDDMHKFMKKNNIEALFDTPRHRPEFTKDDKHTYYQVMFESPDKILFEVVYVGLK